MSDDFATEVLTKSRKGILRVRGDRKERIERMRAEIAELEAEVAHDNDLLRQLDDAIQARAALSPAPSEEAGKANREEIQGEVGREFPNEPAAEAKGEDEADEEAASRAEPADTITIAASEQHAEESARAQSLPPLLPPEPPPAATPEQLEAVGVIDGEAGWWARKLAKEPA